MVDQNGAGQLLGVDVETTGLGPLDGDVDRLLHGGVVEWDGNRQVVELRLEQGAALALVVDVLIEGVGCVLEGCGGLLQLIRLTGEDEVCACVAQGDLDTLNIGDSAVDGVAVETAHGEHVRALAGELGGGGTEQDGEREDVLLVDGGFDTEDALGVAQAGGVVHIKSQIAQLTAGGNLAQDDARDGDGRLRIDVGFVIRAFAGQLLQTCKRAGDDGGHLACEGGSPGPGAGQQLAEMGGGDVVDTGVGDHLLPGGSLTCIQNCWLLEGMQRCQ